MTLLTGEPTWRLYYGRNRRFDISLAASIIQPRQRLLCQITLSSGHLTLFLFPQIDARRLPTSVPAEILYRDSENLASTATLHSSHNVLSNEWRCGAQEERHAGEEGSQDSHDSW